VPVRCDRHRIAQLLSNLLANALAHGAADQPVDVSAWSDAKVFEVRVSNGGEPISDAAMANLFEPFQRSESDVTRPGLGLGLFIAKEIALAHAGTLTVESTADRTSFIFRMPVKGP
jgi:sigma-B regulation protein RsbU (phosphoserine phosphatase)